MDERDVGKILLFREDISPFLVHLTRDTSTSAKTNLQNIFQNKELRYSDNGASDARFGYDYEKINAEIITRFFSAVSFTETPLNEIHNLLEISNRKVDLQPYGLVFLKNNLKKKGVSPVIYLNNYNLDKIDLVKALCNLIDTNSEEAEKILPLISIFGKKLLPIKDTGEHEFIDFTWEREWRYSSSNKTFKFENEDVFIGLCPHEDITEFEKAFSPILFIDPIRNMKWYAEKLIESRQRVDLKNSVV